MSQRKSSARKSSQRGSQRGSGSGHIPASFVPSPGPIYQVPPSLGYERHTITLSRAPAYSMGGRISEQQRSGSGGPGPAGYSIAANYTRTGSAAIPRVSMSGRHKSLTYSSTPGPGAYAPEKFGDPMARRSPRWSMSDRTSLHKSSDTPGPGKKPNMARLFLLSSNSRLQPNLHNRPNLRRTPLGPVLHDQRKNENERFHPRLRQLARPGRVWLTEHSIVQPHPAFIQHAQSARFEQDLGQ